MLRLVIIFILTFFTGCLNSEDDQSKAQAQVDKFLNLIKQNDFEKAYLSTDARFKSSASFLEFKNLLEYYHLDDFHTYSLKNAKLVKGVYNFDLEIVSKKEIIVPIEMRFVKQANTFTCAYLKPDQKQYFINSGMEEPSSLDMQKIAYNTILDFQKACKTHSFEDWHKHSISEIWAKKTDPVTLRETYRSFLNENFQLASLRDYRMILSAKSGLRIDGSLFIKGEIISSVNLAFEIEYLYENANFMPVGLVIGI